MWSVSHCHSLASAEQWVSLSPFPALPTPQLSKVIGLPFLRSLQSGVLRRCVLKPLHPYFELTLVDITGVFIDVSCVNVMVH